VSAILKMVKQLPTYYSAGNNIQSYYICQLACVFYSHFIVCGGKVLFLTYKCSLYRPDKTGCHFLLSSGYLVTV